MAEQRVEEEELELADADAAVEDGKGKKKLIIVISIVVLLLLAGGGAGIYFSGQSGDGDQAVVDEAESESQQKAATQPAIYVTLDPPFTVNLKGESRARYLQIAIEVLTRDPAVEEAIRVHGPVIRNNLVLLLGDKTSQDLADRKGKEQLQQEVLQGIRAALKESGAADSVENVLFTTFVMQ